VLQFRLRDRFGDNGLVSAMLLADGAAGDWRIENWVMSCRVFGRQLEEEALNVAAEQAAQRGIRRLVAEFVPTAKNTVVADLYARLGFDCVERRGDGSSRWELPVAGFAPRRTHIARTA
jgi:FkbH-like protein